MTGAGTYYTYIMTGEASQAEASRALTTNTLGPVHNTRAAQGMTPIDSTFMDMSQCTGAPFR